MSRPQPPRQQAALRVRLRDRAARAAQTVWPRHPTTLGGLVAVARPKTMAILRLTAATTVGFIITRLLEPGSRDLTGALTALLVVQASSIGTLKMGWLRVLAVLTGVLVSVGISTVVGLSWWSLGLVVALALALGHALRLGDQVLETPISAMLILSAGISGQAAELRVLNTFVGACVGISFMLLLPPSLPTRLASRRVRAGADAVADLLSGAAEALTVSPPDRAMVDSWIGELRPAVAALDEAAAMVEQASDSRKFNPRAIAVDDIVPLLRSGLDTLENCHLAVRALFVLLRQQVPEVSSPADADDDLRAVFAIVMQHAAESVRGFGALVEAEAEGNEADAELSFGLSLEMLREARAILTELMLVGTHDTTMWLLRSSTLAAVEQVLLQLDIEERARVREQWAVDQSRRVGANLPELLRDSLPHHEVPLPRGLERGIREGKVRDFGEGLVRGSRQVLGAGLRKVARVAGAGDDEDDLMDGPADGSMDAPVDGTAEDPAMDDPVDGGASDDGGSAQGGGRDTSRVEEDQLDADDPGAGSPLAKPTGSV